MKERLLRAYFTEGELMGDHETLVRLGVQAGLEEDAIRETLAGDRYALGGGTWAQYPDLEKQVTDLPKYLGAQGAQIVADADNYLAGVNEYILEAKLDPTKLPGEYAAIGRPLGPDLFKPADLIATAALVGGIFGKGGGKELEFSQLADALDAKFGKHNGAKAFQDFRAAEPFSQRHFQPERLTSTGSTCTLPGSRSALVIRDAASWLPVTRTIGIPASASRCASRTKYTPVVNSCQSPS